MDVLINSVCRVHAGEQLHLHFFWLEQVTRGTDGASASPTSIMTAIAVDGEAKEQPRVAGEDLLSVIDQAGFGGCGFIVEVVEQASLVWD